MAEAAPEIVEGDAEELSSLQVESLFDDEERDRIREAASARAESHAAFLRDAVLDRVADALGEEGHLECWVDGCEETFTSERRRRGHVGRVHSDNLPEGDFWCGICGYGPTAYSGVGAHHGQRHAGEDVRALDHEPDRDELLDPDDVPDYMDQELLERLYHECDGNISEMCRQHDFDVTHGRVRHYLVEFGIHESTPNGVGVEGQDHRDPELLQNLYDEHNGVIADIYRAHQFDVGYPKLVQWLKKLDIHDPIESPGRAHGRGGPKPSTSTPPETDENRVDDVDDASEDLGTGRDLPPDEQAFILEVFPWPPASGTYHTDDGCWTLNRSDSDEDTVPLPWPRSELEDDEDWSECGHCAKSSDDADEEDPVEEDVPDLGPLDVDDPADLRLAYQETDTIADAAEAFPDSTYGVVRQYLIEEGIHVPESQRSTEPDPPVRDDPPRTDDVDDEPDLDEQPSGPPIEWDFEPGFTTVAEQEEVSSKRLVEDNTCTKCGEPYEGDGVCPSCSDGVVEDLVTDGGTVQVKGYCPACGEPYGSGAYRCDGELPDGTRCGKDLVEEVGR